MWTNWPYNRKIKSSEMSKSSSPQALPRKFSFVFVVDNDQCPFDEFFFIILSVWFFFIHLHSFTAYMFMHMLIYFTSSIYFIEKTAGHSMNIGADQGF